MTVIKTSDVMEMKKKAQKQNLKHKFFLNCIVNRSIWYLSRKKSTVRCHLNYSHPRRPIYIIYVFKIFDLGFGFKFWLNINPNCLQWDRATWIQFKPIPSPVWIFQVDLEISKKAVWCKVAFTSNHML